MKTVKITLVAALMAFIQFTLAQSGSWNKAGNSLSGTEKFGSTNSKPLRFFTNNTQRMTLDPNGRLGIGITTAQAKFHIADGSSSTLPMFNTTIITESSSDNFINVLAPGSNSTGIYFGANFNSREGGVIYNGSFAKDGLQFVTKRFPRMTLTGTGALGIGTDAPKAPLHVTGTRSGITPLANSTIVTDNKGDNIISLLAPTTNKTAVLFGTGISNQDGAIVYNNPSVPRGFQFNTANITRMTLISNGFLGLNTINPRTELHLVHADGDGLTNGLRLQNEKTTVNWTLYVSAASTNLQLFSNGDMKGFFERNSGNYVSISDARRKKM